MRPIHPAFPLGTLAALVGAGAAHAQPREVLPYPDDSVLARDALPRVLEFAAARNYGEAVRVLQSVLDTDAESVVESGEKQLYIPVRDAVHRLLLENPELLQRYRTASDARAQELFKAGDLRTVERSYFLTGAGLSATLALAQVEIEAARFESARLVLEQAPSHPDFGAGTNAADAAKLASLLARYIPRPPVIEFARTLRERAGLPAATVDEIEWPASLTRPWRSPLRPQPGVDLTITGLTPLQSAMIEEMPTGGEDAAAALARSLHEQASREGQTAWVLPSVRDDVLYINDGATIAALDHATLAPLWRTRPGYSGVPPIGRDLTTYTANSWKGLEDVATVTLHSGLLLAVTGTPAAGGRTGDRRVHALDAATGEMVWSVEVSALDPALADTYVRGPALVEGDTAVITARRPNGQNRTIGLYLVGLDVHTGALRWVRHVGSIGSVTWSRQQSQPEGAAISHGLVFRTDEMGIVAAVEVASGRPRWVRLVASGRSAEGTFAGPDLPPPYELRVPIVDGDSLIAIDPASGAIVRYDAATGRQIESRRITEAGPRDAAYAPQYLVAMEQHVAVVCQASVVFLPLTDLEKGEVRLGPALDGTWTPKGRAVASAGELLIPVREGVLRINPARPRQPDLVKLEASGNLVLAGAEGSPHPIIADGTRVHTYLKWEDARAVLQQRIDRNPGDHRPLLTYIELASRAGRNELTPELADRVLAIAAAQPTSRGVVTRTELFELLLAMVRAGRPQPVAGPRVAYESLSPITDTAMLDSVLQRLGLAGEDPAQQVEYLFELAALRETQGRAPDAVEALQRVLLEPALASCGTLTQQQGSPTAKSIASVEATFRLTSLLRRAGHGAYTAFDAQAVAEFAALPADADGVTLAAAAKRFPFAAMTPEIWRRASAWYLAQNKPAESRAALGQGLLSAETSFAVGRAEQLGAIGSIATELIAFASANGQNEAAARLAQRLTAAYPGLSIESPSAADERRAALARREAPPRLGDAMSPTAQVIPGWTPVDSLLAEGAGRAGDCVAMINESRQRLALWGTNLATDQLEMLWDREVGRAEPVLLGIRHDQTFLYWPSPGGGELESVSNSSGRALWRSRDFTSFFESGAVAPGQRMRAPLDQDTAADDFIVALSADAIVLVQRSGRCVAFSLANGEPLWRREVNISRIFEICIVGDRLLIAGIGQPTEKAPSPSVLRSVSLRNGGGDVDVPTEALGDHVRWMRPIDAGEALVSTSNGLLRINCATGVPAWSISGPPCAMSASGWVVGQSAFITDDESRLWAVSLADGKVAEKPCDTRAKVSYPMRGAAVGGRFALLSSSGAAIFGQDGRLLGADTINSPAKLLPPVLADGRVVAIESYDERAGQFGDDSMSVVRMYFLDTTSARLVASHRVGVPDPQIYSLAAVDGKVLVSVGAATLVFSAPK